jgi:hypothetical protein
MAQPRQTMIAVHRADGGDGREVGVWFPATGTERAAIAIRVTTKKTARAIPKNPALLQRIFRNRLRLLLKGTETFGAAATLLSFPSLTATEKTSCCSA